jgi:hypothetical protein
MASLEERPSPGRRHGQLRQLQSSDYGLLLAILGGTLTLIVMLIGLARW